MNYKVTETTPDSFTVWDGKTMHPDFAGKPMGEMTFINQPGHEYLVGDIVYLTVRFIAHAPNPDRDTIEKRLAEGAGARMSHQLGTFNAKEQA